MPKRPSIKLYNTLTRKRDNFKPIKKGHAGVYTCGPTVYDYAHIGNLRSYIFADILKRVLAFNDYKVKHVMNITDVGHLVSDADAGEDKMMKALKREKLEPTKSSMFKLANKYTRAFQTDIKKLNIKEPSTWCKATDHIKEMVGLVKILLEKKYAYETSTAIYYDISKFKDYGKLAKLSLEQLEAGARVEVDPEKKNPLDFVLWFKAVGKHKNHIMQWDSPFGKGFPGWHIECSAMSSKYLGKQFDIHTGGIDHIPIHHTNEIAQSEAAFGKKPWVKYWLHNEFLVLAKGKKMAKSGEGFITLSVLEEKGFHPLDYRYFCLGTHYRKPLMFSYEALEGAKNTIQKLTEKIIELKENGSTKENKQLQKEYLARFTEEINDDLNTPKALAVLWDVIKEIKLASKEKYKLILKFDEVLGLDLKSVKKTTISSEVKSLVKQRESARKDKDWQKADQLRDNVNKLGYSIEDTKEGPKIKRL